MSILIILTDLRRKTTERINAEMPNWLRANPNINQPLRAGFIKASLRYKQTKKKTLFRISDGTSLPTNGFVSSELVNVCRYS